MLGAYADQFFHKQARERVVAQSPNGMAGGYSVPDRESPGTNDVTLTNGTYEMPGPQAVVDANTMMPVSNSMLPGMGDDLLPETDAMATRSPSMLPGMGEMLPGMGMINLRSPLVIGLAVVAGYLLLTRRRR